MSVQGAKICSATYKLEKLEEDKAMGILSIGVGVGVAHHTLLLFLGCVISHVYLASLPHLFGIFSLYIDL
jgi:hypothetical protein